MWAVFTDGNRDSRQMFTNKRQEQANIYKQETGFAQMKMAVSMPHLKIWSSNIQVNRWHGIAHFT